MNPKWGRAIERALTIPGASVVEFRPWTGHVDGRFSVTIDGTSPTLRHGPDTLAGCIAWVDRVGRERQARVGDSVFVGDPALAGRPLSRYQPSTR